MSLTLRTPIFYKMVNMEVMENKRNVFWSNLVGVMKLVGFLLKKRARERKDKYCKYIKLFFCINGVTSVLVYATADMCLYCTTKQLTYLIKKVVSWEGVSQVCQDDME